MISLINTEPSEHHKYLHAVLVMSLLVQLMDDLEGTRYYRFEVKKSAMQFLRSVCPHVDHDMMVLCRQVNGKGVTGLMIEHENFMKTLAGQFTSNFPIVTAILQQFQKDPEFVLKQLDISIETK